MIRAPNYSQALRAIGQDLGKLDFKAFDIKSEGKDYLIRVATSPEPLELRYAPEDIEHLEREGQAKRRDSSRIPDFTSSSQVLRAVGDYLDGKDGRLVGISRRALLGGVPLVTIEYETLHDRKREELLASGLYDLCIGMYKQRTKGSPL